MRERVTLINEYNAMIHGYAQLYFQIATCVSSDFADMGREVDAVEIKPLKAKGTFHKGRLQRVFVH